MRIINIIPGSGGSFYCGNCLRDSGYVNTLRELGYDVIKLPLYLPLFQDEHDLNHVPVFYGAISTYVKQVYPIFRKMPLWFEKLLDSPSMLRLASKMGSSTKAKGLEDMTVSMLQGSNGLQKDELQRMIHWLKTDGKPDVIHLSNALLLGMAPEIKNQLNIPIVCSLQDENQWLDPMSEKYRVQSWELMAETLPFVDAFVAVSDFYANYAQKKIHIPREKIHVIHIGIDTSEYAVKKDILDTPVIGYMSRINEENGFGVLVDAFIQLKQAPAHKSLRLKVTGGYTSDDIRFIKQQKSKIKKANLQHYVDFVEEFEGEARKEFLRSISVLTVPVLIGEAFGLYLLESMASGVPVVQPALGAFPEIIEKTGGGLYEPNTAEKLANSLNGFLGSPDNLHSIGLQSRKLVEEHFDNKNLTEQVVALYKKVISG